MMPARAAGAHLDEPLAWLVDDSDDEIDDDDDDFGDDEDEDGDEDDDEEEDGEEPETWQVRCRDLR